MTTYTGDCIVKENGWNIYIPARAWGGEIWLNHGGACGQFVARFKYSQPRRNAVHFTKFLVKHFTPEQYFAKRAERNERGMEKAPLTILEEAGYVSLNMKRAQRIAAVTHSVTL